MHRTLPASKLNVKEKSHHELSLQVLVQPVLTGLLVKHNMHNFVKLYFKLKTTYFKMPTLISLKVMCKSACSEEKFFPNLENLHQPMTLVKKNKKTEHFHVSKIEIMCINNSFMSLQLGKLISSRNLTKTITWGTWTSILKIKYDSESIWTAKHKLL